LQHFDYNRKHYTKKEGKMVMEFCTNCGQPLDPVTHSCPVCGRSYPGAPVQAQAPVQSGFVPALKQRIGSGLLLALSILSTISVVFSFVGNSTVTDTGFNFNFNILASSMLSPSG
jgi:hypothetical protein